MFKKSFITDCEGPLTLNDNAFELSKYFIDDGANLFRTLSLYDDFLVDIVKKENYKAGNTLKLILPFFALRNLKNKDLIEFSQNNICTVPDAKLLLNYLKEAMNIYIVSTSYTQYIEAVSKYMEVPFENTFYTDVDMDSLSLNEDEINKLKNFQDQIIQNQGDYELYDDIFFNQIANMDICEKIKDVEIVGGPGKKFAIDKIIKRDNININGILYIGDSITDVEPLEFAKLNNGVSISFNGNEYPLKVAQIAIVSKSAIATAVIANIYAENDKNVVLNFIREYNENKNLKELFNDYNINIKIKDRFFEVFNNENYPIIQIINDKNFDEILKASKSMRNNIRGQDIGELG
ncbi:membrane protein [Methanobrevibacter oralis]|uniref:Haloacid dehalogenase-like hydrolase n=1 Tax=Methanobrevibacter oralis TaxID=66851 RepID=A0A166BHN5_METOA|nr:membrane protein [Methanobrevibacter oralis]KZX13363.1 haloacid dehalogenase-like hydrolase [Methanobrevibacter oralis]